MRYPHTTYPACVMVALFFGSLLLALPAQSAHRIYDAEGRRLEISVSNAFSARSKERVIAWTEQLAESLTLVYGHWPREQWEIRVEAASGSADEPIPWAQVNRGAIDKVTFYVAGNPDTRALLEEWTGYHEIAHLLLPYRGWGDGWFSEGLATYYQHLLQARFGLIDEQTLWQQLYEGFIRGREDVRFDGMALTEVNRQMRSRGGYMRVYWSGAWFFLAADLRLRAASDGTHSLDDALLALNKCCAREALSVPAIIEKLDASIAEPVFEPLYHVTRASTRVPEFELLFRQLGITVINGEVALANAGPAASRRQQFLQSTAL